MVVGIPGWLTGPNSFGIGISYLEFIREYLKADDIRILAPDSPIFKDIELLILPGGPDINPLRYGEMPSVYTDKPDPLREWFDVHKLPRYIEMNTPIFGICRGLQSIAVIHGAKLCQNMHHETNKQDDPYSSVHKLRLLNDKDTRKISVNSRHHQCMIYTDAIPEIKVLATHNLDPGAVEAIAINGKPIRAVQWHPEDLDDMSGIMYTMQLIKQIIKI